MGLKHDEAYSEYLLEGVFKMLDLSTSRTYQGIKAKGEAAGEIRGRIKEARRLLLILGVKRLGKPDQTTGAAVEAINSPERLEALVERLFEVNTWGDLLAA
ncbi:MAG: hypothetical protein ACLQVD_13950 [Capsulimonadaceae bacterium]